METITKPNGANLSNTNYRGNPSIEYDVTVIGAGPYGLAAAAHLKAKGLGVRVFGEPMDFWANKMPEGMLLRSPRAASNIASPSSAFSLEAFEAASGKKPEAPLPLETFVAYGRWFHQKIGADLDPSTVLQVNREDSGFRLTLENGTSIRTRRVVVAAGIGPFRRKPKVFDNLPAEQASHCYEGRKVAELAGKRIAVIGAGQSALESAALLQEAGSQVEVIATVQQLRWIGQHPWLHNLGPLSKILYSYHDIGPVGLSRLVAYPNLLAMIPLGLRDKIRKRAVRPAGSAWLPARLVPVKMSTGRGVQSAQSTGGEVVLKLDDGTERRVDHVLMGTGYDVDVAKYEFLPGELLKQVRQIDRYPELTSGFRSSVPGLHFIGAPAARSFGPLFYFVTGTDFTAKRLSSYIQQNRVQTN